MQPFIDEAVALGVRQFSFTGGEPFLIKDLLRILSYALERAPCLVLTNGVDAVPKRLAKLAELRSRPHALALRVSIDYPERARHDAGRGAGNFLKAWAALALLHGAGFRVSIARQMEPGENRSAVEDAYRRLMCAYALPQDLNIVAFPDFGAPGTQPPVPYVTESCMTRYHTEGTRHVRVQQDGGQAERAHARLRLHAGGR